MPITKTKCSYTYDLSDYDFSGVSGRRANQIKRAVGDLLVQEIQRFTDNQSSPVKNFGSFSPLTKEYKAKKQAEGKGSDANLKLNFEMLDSFKVNPKEEGVELKITDREEKLKAHRHNVFGYNGRKQRRFLPDDDKDQSFKSEIDTKVKNLVEGMLNGV